jgi:antitoxin component YwqK of YwqJK toxin-antitoxin module
MLKLLSLISGLFLLTPLVYGQSDTLNRTDEEGKKQGYWIITGDMKPGKGFCDSCIYEKGRYVDDRKNGKWTKYHLNGQRRLVGEYVNNRPNGDYTKFYISGRIMEVGNFKGGKLKKVYLRYHESGCLAAEKFYNEEGKEDGCITYYFDDCDSSVSLKGSIEFEFEKENGVVEGTRRSRHEGWVSICGIKYVPNYDSINSENLFRDRMGWSHTYNDCEEIGFDGIMRDGKPWRGTRYIYNENCELEYSEIWNEGQAERRVSPPSTAMGIPHDGRKVNSNGYNKLYNKNSELVLEGDFKKNLLYNGKYYKYDSDGILLKLEIWKNGKYHSDGQL